jgi:hypothetical protein
VTKTDILENKPKQAVFANGCLGDKQKQAKSGLGSTGQNLILNF